MRLAACFLSILVLLTSRPSHAIGDVDEAKIMECVQSAEKVAPLKSLDSEAAAAKCLFLETSPCTEAAQKEWSHSAAYGVCLGSELAIWEKLLAQAYEAAANTQREYDRLIPEKQPYPDFEPVLPAFVDAHERWQAFVTAECNVAHVEHSGGTYSRYGVSRALCAIPLTARRVFLYRDRARQNARGNEHLRRQK